MTVLSPYHTRGEGSIFLPNRIRVKRDVPCLSKTKADRGGWGGGAGGGAQSESNNGTVVKKW